MLTTPVRFTIESEGPVGNILLSEIASKLGHGADMQFNSILEKIGSDFLLSSGTIGWYNNGIKIDMSDFSFPGQKNEVFPCSFFLSPQLLDKTAKLVIVDIYELINMDVNPEQHDQL
jgi:hypothetical protein